jgi:DNA polymerase-1
MRGLIKPPEGYAIAYVDWEQQEFGAAPALSGDDAMLAAYLSGDAYLGFAKQACAVPPDATKRTHGETRELYKSCALAVQYGMGYKRLAFRIAQPPIAARELIQKHKDTCRKFWA